MDVVFPGKAWIDPLLVFISSEVGSPILKGKDYNVHDIRAAFMRSMLSVGYDPDEAHREWMILLEKAS